MEITRTEHIKVLIVDDQQIIIDGLTSLLNDSKEIIIVAGCNNALEITHLIASYLPDVILLDMNMPIKDGLECIKEILLEYPNQKIMMLTGYDDIALIREALKLGAIGYVLKNIGKDDLINAVKTVADGQRYLDIVVQDKIIEAFTNELSLNEQTSTSSNKIDHFLSKREKEILKMIADGKKSAEIASLLFISINTVDTHRKNIIAKCEVKNTAELISFANKNGLL